MPVKLNRELKPIKSEWCSRAPELGLAAHGYNEEVADRNLERTVRLFLTPLQRAGTLQEAITALGLEIVEGQDDLQVVLQ